ncbi:MAG: Rrf2 family transcriptional regulator [SAR324 cluster bacterium]|uniref:Rrf2 family transcriptional regulator n=1 Tax=SAR324 cluster bacterium TaxID=2024889 RepID=A0A7X9FRK8_9DELT|nr:Rrf2 family transcriptional regulator [SAR324 cluster bacterium]
MLLAIQALLIIGKAFRNGGRLPNDLEIAENLGCSSLVLRPILSELKHAEIINQSDSREGGLALARSPEKISLLELRELLLRGASPLHYPLQMSAVFTYLASSDCASIRSLADILSIEDT